MEVAPEKGRGLKFAEQQMLRHGWEHGKGLGRGENGISEAIKVKVKCDKGGVGHKEGEQFTFHWWDHVFNKASSSLQVESDQNGIQLKKTVEEDEDDGMISNKKPRRAALAKAKLYGCFVKSATLLSGHEQPEPKTSSPDDDSSSSSSDEEDDHKLDLSSTTKLSDSDLMKACGGRTAHKGARHGLTMSAKLARLEQQEAEFMAKYGKKTQTAEETDVKQLNGDEASDVKPKKKKKKKKNKVSEETTEGGETHVENGDDSNKTKRKHKKKKNDKDQQTPAESSSPEETPELHTTVNKKKKKKKRSRSEEEEADDPESRHPDSIQNQDCAPKPKKKKKKNAEICENAAAEEEEETAVKQKRKKCKKDKTVSEFSHDEETLPPKKKKKKKKSKE